MQAHMPKFAFVGFIAACTGKSDSASQPAPCGDHSRPYSSVEPVNGPARGKCGEWQAGAVHVQRTVDREIVQIGLLKCIPGASEFADSQVVGPGCQGDYLSAGLQIPLFLHPAYNTQQVFEIEPRASNTPGTGGATVGLPNSFSELEWEGVVNLHQVEVGLSGSVDARTTVDGETVALEGTFCWPHDL